MSSQASAQRIVIGCEGKNPQAKAEICLALQSVMQEMLPASSVALAPSSDKAADVKVTLTLLSHSPTEASASLAWHGAGGGRQGPDLTVSIVDKTLDAAAYKRFAASLLQSAGLPDAIKK
ncbi:hypothetical protein [Algicella marina]|uniref:Uncharacterized protein n=1 Tax=Algicella marina TaxID=2683284 RepID=A0A6P1SYW0_9RHOB|nr:hypothetical protein [Algicella marina]QHQ34199.1 hypothetical protein GO499_02840 [Algicella marina]